MSRGQPRVPSRGSCCCRGFVAQGLRYGGAATNSIRGPRDSVIQSPGLKPSFFGLLCDVRNCPCSCASFGSRSRTRAFSVASAFADRRSRCPRGHLATRLGALLLAVVPQVLASIRRSGHPVLGAKERAADGEHACQALHRVPSMTQWMASCFSGLAMPSRSRGSSCAPRSTSSASVLGTGNRRAFHRSRW